MLLASQDIPQLGQLDPRILHGSGGIPTSVDRPVAGSAGNGSSSTAINRRINNPFEDDLVLSSDDEFDCIPASLPKGRPLRVPVKTRVGGTKMAWSWTVPPFTPGQLIPNGYENAPNQLPRREGPYVPPELRPRKRKRAPETEEEGSTKRGGKAC